MWCYKQVSSFFLSWINNWKSPNFGEYSLESFKGKSNEHFPFWRGFFAGGHSNKVFLRVLVTPWLCDPCVNYWELTGKWALMSCQCQLLSCEQWRPEKICFLNGGPYEAVTHFSWMPRHLHKFPSYLGTSQRTRGNSASFLWSQKTLIKLIPRGILLQPSRNSALNSQFLTNKTIKCRWA